MSEELSDWEKAKARAGITPNDAEPRNEATEPLTSESRWSAPPFSVQSESLTSEEAAAFTPEARKTTLPSKEAVIVEIPVRISDADIFLADDKFITPDHARRPTGPRPSASVTRHDASKDRSTEHEGYGSTNPQIISDLQHDTEHELSAESIDDASPPKARTVSREEAEHNEQFGKLIDSGKFFAAFTLRSPEVPEHVPNIEATFSALFQGRVSRAQLITRTVIAAVVTFVSMFGSFVVVSFFNESIALGLTLAIILVDCLLFYFYFLSLIARRFHDAGYGGHWALLMAFVPLIGLLIALVLPRQEFHNIYGNYEP